MFLATKLHAVRGFSIAIGVWCVVFPPSDDQEVVRGNTRDTRGGLDGLDGTSQGAGIPINLVNNQIITC